MAVPLTSSATMRFYSLLLISVVVVLGGIGEAGGWFNPQGLQRSVSSLPLVVGIGLVLAGTLLGLRVAAQYQSATAPLHQRFEGAARACASIFALLCLWALFVLDAPAIAFSGILLGLALSVGPSAPEARVVVAQVLACTIIITAPRTTISAILPIPALAANNPELSAVPTVLLALLGVGIILLHARRGLLVLLRSSGIGGVLLRRSLPVIFVLPLLTEALLMWNLRRGVVWAGVEIIALSAIAALVCVWNITLLDQLDRTRREAEDRFAKVFEASPLGISITTLAEGRYLDVNRRWLDMLGYTHDEVVGRTSHQLSIWADSAERERFVARYQADGAPLEITTRIRTKTNRLVTAHAAVDVIDIDGQACFIALFADVTEQERQQALARAAEQALQQRTAFYETILDSAGAVIYVRDLQQRYLFVNRQFEQLFRLERAQVIGQSHEALFPAELVAQWEANDQELLEHPTTREYEETAQLGDELRTYRSVKFPLCNAAGQPYAVGGISTDVTERKRLEVQLLHAQRMDSLGQLAGGVAHDFNNLLTAIMGYASMIRAGLPLESPLEDDIDELLKATNRATVLTRQLLTFARRQPLAMQVFNVNDLINDFDKMLRRVINVDIQLSTRLTPHPSLIKADSSQIEQVLLNLVLNACDAMPNGGRLLIETANVDFDARYIQDHLDVSPGRYVMLAVSDTGIGMSSEVRARLFEPFFTTKEAGKGTGLGLSICYGIVKQHGGAIYVYSEIGKGSSLKVYLPAAADTAAAGAVVPEVAIAPSNGETILVVEDEDAVRALIVRILCGNGYTVLEAAEGSEALELAYAHAPAPIDLLLTDVVMPRIGGAAILEQLRDLFPGIPTLFVSGYTAHALPADAQQAANVPLLSKPFTPSALLRAVRAALDS